MKRRILLLGGAIAGLLVCSLFSQTDSARIFPFQLPWNDSSPTITDLGYLNEKPAGNSGFIRVGTDGHLYAGERRIRFLGVNFTNRSCIPEHADADGIAGRLAKFGVNIVRFHLMDADWSGQVIFDASKPGTRALDPVSLEKLDYFIAQLKAHGIYSDINLLTGRNFRASDGINSSIETMEWKEKQTPAFFDRTLIDLQKEYATQLLGHLNPYTGNTYASEPAVALVELVNEHGLIHAWHSSLIDDLPDFFTEELRRDWNLFLQQRYSSQAELEEEWTKSSPAGPQMLRNPGFAAGLENWNVEQHEGARVTATAANQGPAGKPALQLKVTAPGSQNWHVQLNQGGLPVQMGTVYTLSFWARADRVKTISVQIEQAHDPWSGLGFDRPFQVTTSWQKFQFSLELTGSDTNARLNFRDMADQLTSFYFSDLSLAPGGSLGLFPDEKLESGSIRLFLKSEIGARTEAARHTWMEFLWEKEDGYWREMRAHIKETLGVRALLVGTIVGTSPPNLMDLFDVIDSHSYWQHPSFEISWGSPWWIRNSSVLGESNGGTVSDLAMKRIRRKPFSVSEYNHPFPNSFSSETFPFLAAYAAFQDWDAIFGYTYSDGSLNWQEDRQSGYFDLDRCPAKMISLNHAACLFRRGDLKAGEEVVAAEMSRAQELELLSGAGAWRLVDARDVGMSREAALLHRTELGVESSPPASGALKPSQVTLPTDGRFLSDTGELEWDTRSGSLTFRGDGSWGLIGATGDRSYQLGDFQVSEIGSLQDWAAVLISRTRQAGETRRFLVSTLGIVRNHAMIWQHYPSYQSIQDTPPSDANLTLGSWGTAPVEVEGITCTVTLPYAANKVEVFALDETGARKGPVRVHNAGEGSLFTLDPSFQTLWYEVQLLPFEAARAIAGYHSGPSDFVGLALSNPSEDPAAVRVTACPTGEISSDPEAADLDVPAASQVARLLPEFFPSTTTASEGWIEILSDNEKLSAFAQFGDAQLGHLDGLNAVPASPGPLYLNRVYEGSRQFRGKSVRTWIAVANPGTAPVWGELILLVQADPSESLGQLREGAPRASFQLGAKSSQIKLASQWFGGPVDGGSVILRIISGIGLVAATIVEFPDQNTIFALNGTEASTATTLYSPQLANLPGSLFSSIRLINPNSSTREVTLKALSDEGEPLAPSFTVVLSPNGYLQQDAGELFRSQLGAERSFVGSLLIEAPSGGIVGDVVFGSTGLAYAAASPLQGGSYHEAILGHVANLPGLFFTGLALLNPEKHASQIEVSVFSADGTSTGTASVNLQPQGRLSDVLSNLIQGAGGQVGGYIILRSSSPFFAQELFGTQNLSLLSAVSAQPLN